MEEEEIVISSWQQSDFPKDPNGSFSRTIKRGSSKENIDMNAWLIEQDSKLTSKIKSEDDEIMLDNESLSRLIEGDLKSDEKHESFNRSRKPKPKPRHETRFLNTENQIDNDSTDKLFSDRKDKAENLFSDRKDKTENLFSDRKDKAENLFSDRKDKAENLFSDRKDKTENLFSDRKDKAENLFSDRKDKAENLFSDRKDKTENLFSDRKDKADKLFSGVKDKADKLFSGRKDSPDKLFSGEKVKEKNDDMITSPRPVPRPRSKPREKDHENKELNSLNETTDSNKITADHLFDSMGKSSKSVSFSDVNASKGSTRRGSESGDKKSSNDRNSSNERIPPKKAPRSPRDKVNSSSPRKGKSSDESDSEQRTSEHKKRPQPPQRRHDRKFSENNSSTADHDSGSHRISNGMELFHGRDGSGAQHQKHFRDDPSRGDSSREFKQKMRDDTMSESRTKERRTPRREGETPSREGGTPRREGEASRREGGTPRWEQKEYENYGFSRKSEGYSRSKHDRYEDMKERDRKGNVTDTFEDHVPVSNEIVLDDEDDRTHHHSRRLTGAENKGRSPMKAHKSLNEMTKPDVYNFKYESRDSPQNDTFSRSKGRSSSLTDLNSWKNSQFDHDEESLDSSRSGFTSSRGIRDAVYAEWLQKKRGKLKEAVRKKVEEQKNEEEKIKEKREQEVLAKKAFEAWSSKKEVVIKTEVKKKKEIKNKELDEKREKVIKKQDDKKFFESWKSKKDEVLKDSYKDKKAREREDKQRKIEDHKEKIEIAKKAFDKWKSEKDEELKGESRSSRQADKLKTKYEKEAEMEKREECEKTFQEFLRKKGTGKRAPPSPTLTQRAWCPGSLTRGTNLIPEKVKPVIAPPALNRSRSFSGTTRNMMSFNTTKRSSRGW